MQPILSREDFIAVWNEAESLPQFCKDTGYAYRSASSRASVLRSYGFDVKSFIAGDFYAKIGAKGGKNGKTGGFYFLAKNDPARHREASRRGGSKTKEQYHASK